MRLCGTSASHPLMKFPGPAVWQIGTAVRMSGGGPARAPLAALCCRSDEGVRVIGMATVDTDALFRIAHAAGEDGRLDFQRQCYEQGASLGDPECLQSLGYMYDVGQGVRSDKAKAMALYRRAWRRGSHAAANNIAILYKEQGKLKLMFRWFQRVACAGDGSAHLDMAKCYLNGIGVRKNLQAAMRCLAVASDSFYITEFEREEARELLDDFSLRAV